MSNGASQAVVKNNRRDVISVLQSEDVKQRVALALPRHMRADRMIRVMLTTVNSNPKLLNCTRESLLAALLKCSQYGLEPDGRHAHLIPYKDQVQLIFDYKGLVDLVRRSGEVADIHCDVVYDSDEFEFSYGEGGKLAHKPNLKAGKDRGAIYCAYSFVRLKDGTPSYEVMTVDEIEAIKERSSGWQAFKAGKVSSSTWKTDWSEMAKKTVFRRHTKWLPLSSELREKVNGDDDNIVDANGKVEPLKPVFGAAANLLEAGPQQDQPADESPADSEPEHSPATQPQGKTIHAELADLLKENGFTFDQLRDWCVESKFIHNAGNYGSVDELPDVAVRKLLNAREGLVMQLKEGVAK